MKLRVQVESNPAEIDQIDIAGPMFLVFLECLCILLLLTHQVKYLGFREVSAQVHVLFVKLEHLSEELHMRLCSFLCIGVLEFRQISSLQELVHKDVCFGLDWSVAPDWY